LTKAWSWYQYKRPPRLVLPRVKRPDVVEGIRAIIRERPATYGYRRIHALLCGMGVRCDPKTVLRYMVLRLWLSTARMHRRKPGRRHEGVVAVPEPNTRWSSDITGIKAWNGEKGRLAVILDCADRQVLAYRWGRRIQASDIQDLVKEAMVKRLGTEQVKGLEFLSDNGSEYREGVLMAFLNDAGFTICHTPVRSPESNGISESFFRGFKRDYVYQHECLSFEDIGQHIGPWIDDYNTKAPHGALKMQTPAAFYAAWRLKTGDKLVQK
jgi:putative transposase